MSRPEFPRCVLPAGCISRIREDQAYYDRDPARYEREEQARRERQEEEREQERQAQQEDQRHD